MKLLSPIDKLAEVDLLLDAGADELYGGFVSRKWREKYSILGSANHRYFPSAQIATEQELVSIIKAAHKRGARFYHVLNAPYYLKEQYEDILADAQRFHGLGVDAFIVSDLGLILRLREKLPEAGIHLSTLGTVFNGAGAAFFGNLGIGRIVLPRELSLAEIAGVTASNPGLEFDAFVMIGKCPNIEGFCSFTHNSGKLVWPCEESYTIDVLKGGKGTLDVVSAQTRWGHVNRREACGLCAVKGLSEAGVSALKLVGRGGPSGMKARVTAAVRKVMDLSARLDQESLSELAKGTYRELFGRECNPYICYFPEFCR